jgi:hypothetical protein
MFTMKVNLHSRCKCLAEALRDCFTAGMLKQASRHRPPARPKTLAEAGGGRCLRFCEYRLTDHQLLIRINAQRM